MTYTVKRGYSKREGCRMHGVYQDGKLYEKYVLFNRPNATLIAEWLTTVSYTHLDVYKRQMLAMLQDMDDLLPLHYWNMVVEAERIMFKTWNLSCIKHEIRGEQMAAEDMEDLYRLQ